MPTKSIPSPFTLKETELLRELADKARSYAETDLNKQNIIKSKKLNALESTEPVVFVHPENAWTEIFPEDSLSCEDPLAREWELQLRKRIFHAEEIKSDRIFYDFLEVPWRIDQGDFGVEVDKQVVSDEQGASFSWGSHPIDDLEDDFEKLKFREPIVDRERSERDMDIAHSLFGDILPPRRYHESYWWTTGMTINVIDLMGMENLMMTLIDDPEGIHQLMKFMMDDQMRSLDWYEREGLLNFNATCDYVGSGGAAYTDELPDRPGEEHTAKLSDLWGFSESQETLGVGPEMFAEFILPYQKPIMERFGLSYYGCCEPMEKRFPYVKSVNNLRRVSVSPWADLQAMSDLLKRDYVYVRKAPPMPLCGKEMDEASLREDLQNTLNIAGGLNLEIVMKDTHTIYNEPQRIPQWVQMAREEIDKWAG